MSQRPQLHGQWTAVSIGQFIDPYSVSLQMGCAGACTVYVADPGDRTVYAVHSDGTRKIVLNPGGVTTAFDPVGVSVDAWGRAWIANKTYWEHGLQYTSIWEVNPDGKYSQHLSNVAWPRHFRSVAAWSENQFRSAVYGAAATHHPLTSTGGIYCTSSWHEGTRDCNAGRDRTPTIVNDPYGVAVDQSNRLYVVDARDKKLYHVTPEKLYPMDSPAFADPYGVAVTPDGRYIYVADAGAKKVWERAPDGTWSEVGTFADPYGVAVDNNRTLYVADPGSKHVWKVTP